MLIDRKPCASPRVLHIVRHTIWRLLMHCVCGVAAVLAPLPALAGPVTAARVVDGVWMVQGDAALGTPANRNFISNASFVVTDAGVVVIDALGSPALARELIAEIRRVTDQPIRWLIVTHYHADHIYGLQVFKELGVRILAHPAARLYLGSELAQRRLEDSRQTLAPWIDDTTRLVPADEWTDGAEHRLRVGSVEFVIRHVGPAHTAEDLVVFLPDRGLLFTGDLVFRGRLPFVGQADSQQWISSLERLIAFAPSRMVPGHGPASGSPVADLTLTRDYLVYLRKAMGEAAAAMTDFEAAYASTDWSAFEHLPLFRVANRMNAYNTYLLMEQQSPP